MSLALYRKYRPQRFQDISGQNHIKMTLQNQLETDRVAHAYLLSGPRGTGKTTTARLIAKAVNCLKRKKGESEPCNGCVSCQEMEEARSLDVIEIDAASHTGVDNVRDNIIENSKFSPTSRKYKVFIIDEVHMLSISAFNALLKTLEEPPAHAMFILATTEVYKVPQTIHSRCQHFEFRKIVLKDIVERIGYILSKEEKFADKEVVELIARRAEGSVRDAESLLGQVFGLGEKKITLNHARLVLPFSDVHTVLEFLEYLKSKNTSEALTLVNKIMNEGVDLGRFVNEIIEVLRKILFLHIHQKLDQYTMELPAEHGEVLLKLSKNFSQVRILFIIESLLKAEGNMKICPLPQLPLEISVVEICNAPPEIHGVITASNPLSSQLPQGRVAISSQNNNHKNENIEKAGNSTPINIKNEISLEEVNKKWDEILEHIKNYNHTLFSFIRLHKPMESRENTLQLAVHYSFHKERIEDVKNKLAIENILENIFGTKMRIECVLVEKKDDTPYHSEDKEIEDIVKEFRGSIIE